jgi:hypothetical protein
MSKVYVVSQVFTDGSMSTAIIGVAATRERAQTIISHHQDELKELHDGDDTLDPSPYLIEECEFFE